MSRLIRAVFPGTFDPITLGHEDMLRRACALFDEVIVAVAKAYHKKTMFTLEERLAITRQALADMHCPEADFFMQHMLPCYSQNLDELTRGRF